MRARDEQRKLALRMALTAVQLAEVEQRGELDDAAIVEVIRKEVRRREDALEMVCQSGRADMVAEDEAQVAILRSYLPQLLTAEEYGHRARSRRRGAGCFSGRYGESDEIAHATGSGKGRWTYG